MRLSLTCAQPRAAAIVLALLAVPAWAAAQSITTELDLSAGYSNQDVRAAATQIRVFGELIPKVRFFGEISAAKTAGEENDAFSGAYPYETGVHVIEAYGERLFQTGHLVAGVRGGRFRTPFGLYNRGDHAYNGFLRAPLIRYDGYFALSNNYLEHGVAGFVGMPHLQIESSVGMPADVGEARRRSGVDSTVRVQAYAGPLIVGVSYVRTQPYLAAEFAPGRATFTGFDGRWMMGGMQVRGEWLFGHSFEGTSTDGGYLDLSVHRHEMGPVTAVLRTERLSYDAVPDYYSIGARRDTVGARVYIVAGFCLQVDAIHQSSQIADGHPWALDLGMTYSFRR